MSKDKKSKSKPEKNLKGSKVKHGSKGKAPEPTDEEIIATTKAKVAAKRAARQAEQDAADQLAAEKASKKAEKKLGKKGKTPEAEPVAVAEEIQTETGREFAVGGGKSSAEIIAAAEKVINAKGSSKSAIKMAEAAIARVNGINSATVTTTVLDPEAIDAGVVVQVEPEPEFEIPSDVSGTPDFERDKRYGSPLIMVPGEEKPVKYKRMTTFIGCLEDGKSLSDWGRRIVVAGLAADAVTDTNSTLDPADTLVGQAAASLRQFEKALKVIAKRLAGGKSDELFGAGEAEAAREKAEGEHKKRLNEIAERAFTLGEGKVKAERGTRLHWLTELVDGKIDLPDDVTAEELLDLEAYSAAIKAAGLKVKLIEGRIVNDEFKAAGTFDRTYLYKRPGAARAITVVGDIKSGRIDFGIGKIAMQIAGYATGVLYDPITTDRSPIGASRTVGLLIHLPAGKGVCEIWEIDLVVGTRGLKLAAEVHEWRKVTARKHAVAKPLAIIQAEADQVAEVAAAAKAAVVVAEVIEPEVSVESDVDRGLRDEEREEKPASKKRKPAAKKD